MDVPTLLLLLGVAFVFASVSVSATPDVSPEEWQAFKEKFGKQYNHRQNILHFNIYNRRAKEVRAHNLRFAAGEVSFEMGLNEYSDTKQNLLAFRANEPEPEAAAPPHDLTKPANYKYYDQITEGRDWRTAGIISPVGNQGTDCLACWSFAASGAIEAHLALKNKALVPLSPKHLLDCTPYPSQKCNGGWVSVAFKYVMEHGIATKASYPFTPLSEECRYNRETSAGRIRRYVTLSNYDEKELAEVVYNIGPVAVSVDQLYNAFQNYKNGVLNDTECQSDRRSLRHAVLVVGFGTDPTWGDYWLIKNSYGTSWGEDGYLKLARNAGNMCGVASIPQYPLV